MGKFCSEMLQNLPRIALKLGKNSEKVVKMGEKWGNAAPRVPNAAHLSLNAAHFNCYAVMRDLDDVRSARGIVTEL